MLIYLPNRIWSCSEINWKQILQCLSTKLIIKIASIARLSKIFSIIARSHKIPIWVQSEHWHTLVERKLWEQPPPNRPSDRAIPFTSANVIYSRLSISGYWRENIDIRRHREGDPEISANMVEGTIKEASNVYYDFISKSRLLYLHRSMKSWLYLQLQQTPIACAALSKVGLTALALFELHHKSVHKFSISALLGGRNGRRRQPTWQFRIFSSPSQTLS